MTGNFILVGLGGALGSIARYGCQRWFSTHYPQHFPWGTFAVNITGCLLIGILWGVITRSLAESETWKLFLLTGICGGFTTFSAFSIEGINLLKQDRTGLFLMYIGGSVLLGLLATFAGLKLTGS